MLSDSVHPRKQSVELVLSKNYALKKLYNLRAKVKTFIFIYVYSVCILLLVICPVICCCVEHTIPRSAQTASAYSFATPPSANGSGQPVGPVAPSDGMDHREELDMSTTSAAGNAQQSPLTTGTRYRPTSKPKFGREKRPKL